VSLDDLSAEQRDAILLALRYWKDHWDWECPTLFGLDLGELTAVVNAWPEIVQTKPQLAASAILGTFRELLFGASSVSREEIAGVLGFDYEHAESLVDLLRPRLLAAIEGD
jgi:hypothetical protein